MCVPSLGTFDPTPIAAIQSFIIHLSSIERVPMIFIAGSIYFIELRTTYRTLCHL